jgi:hypothetical protein
MADAQMEELRSQRRLIDEALTELVDLRDQTAAYLKKADDSSS